MSLRAAPNHKPTTNAMQLCYTYATGYRTEERAFEALELMIEECEISPGELPEIVSYKTRDGKTRYAITLSDR